MTADHAGGPADPHGGHLVADDVERWVLTHVPPATRPLYARRLTGGNSNSTEEVTDGSGLRFVLRRPPGGHMLATAHDVLREARIIAALHAAGVPVPEILATADAATLGRAAVLMEHVDGVVCQNRAQAEALPLPVRAATGPALVDALAAVHALDVDAVGLGSLGVREDYLRRQLRRWSRQVETDRRRPTPDLDRAGRLLAENRPAQPTTALVHGDPRLDNCILSPSGTVRALVDWEIAALGDPLADLGVMLAYWAEPGDEVIALHDPPTVAEGFSTRSELTARYLECTGRPANTDVGYHVAFAWWKLACIVEGVWSRAVASNRTLARPLESYADQAARLARHAARLVAAW